MRIIKTVYETSGINENSHVSCIKYRNLNNISHYHSDYELVFINKGNAKIMINEKIFNLGAGESVFIHSNDIHYISSGKNDIITVLKGDKKYFEAIFAGKRVLSPYLSHYSDMEGTLETVRVELLGGLIGCGEMADSIAMQIFIKMLRREVTVAFEKNVDRVPDNAALYHKISKKISDEYNTLTFSDMAEYMHFSEPHFSKVFHNIFGMTFTQYINAVRIAAAVENIREGKLNITEISAFCGFNTIRNFNRVFKRLTGYSPRELPSDYVFLYSLKEGYGLNPTLNSTEIIE